MGYDQGTLYRFAIYAIPLLLILLAVFGFVVDAFDLEPQGGGIVKLTLFGARGLPAQIVFGTWLLEAIGLLALYLLIQGRVGFWWLDGLVTGWIAWVFRGPLLVITIVTAAGQRQDPWWTIAFGWWVLYSICGLSLAILARRSWLRPATKAVAPQTHRPAAVGEAGFVEAGGPDRSEPLLPAAPEKEEDPSPDDVAPEVGASGEEPTVVESPSPSVDEDARRDEPEPRGSDRTI